ncbi:MAG: calcium/sodium antiporter [Myxococcota bacterium]
MLISLLMVLVGLGLLLGGGELLIRGASNIAIKARISPTVVGLTIVAAGTSAPELVVSLSAALAGTPDLAMSNIVGSNIYNIALILGVTSIIQSLKIEGSTVKLEWPVLFLCTCLLHLLGRDGRIDRLEGAFFMAGLVTFVAWTVYIARQEISGDQELDIWNEIPGDGNTSWGVSALMTVGGGLLLAAGAQSLVTGASNIAELLGVSQRIIGLTIVALGTSLPELVTSVVAAWKRAADIAVANVIGSNLFNTLGILGTTAAVTPVPVNDKTLTIDNPWMIGFTLLLFPLMRRKMCLERIEGILLLVLLGVYTFMLYITGVA